jgi:hypothetical protein
MIKGFNFNGGMSEVIEPHLLPENTCELIQNMYLDDNGAWTALPNLTKNTDIGTFRYGGLTAYKVFQWKTANMPSDWDTSKDGSMFVVFNTNGTVGLFYYVTGTGFKSTLISTLTGIEEATVYAWSDAHQFVFVDGRANNPAKRIRIDEQGTVYGGNLAPASAWKFPTLNSLVYDESDQEGTRIGRGAVYAWRAVFVNKFGEKSKPTPTLTVDTYQWQKRGLIEGDSDYTYDDTLRGSLRSAIIGIPEIPAGTVEVELYRADAYGSECITPMTDYRIVTTKEVDESETATTMIDSFPYGVMILDPAVTGSPSGDDISLLNGTVFVANAVNTIDFPFDLETAYVNKITITNPNEYNYVNRWVQINFFDDVKNDGTATHYLENLNLTTEWDTDKMRVFDSDFITPLKVYHYPIASILEDYGGFPIATRLYTFIQIPYMPASTTTTIYFVYGKTNSFAHDYPNAFVELTAIATNLYNFYADLITANPVRGEGTVIATSNKVLTNSTWLNANYRLNNKANSNYDREFDADLLIDNDALHLYDEFAQSSSTAITHKDTSYEYGNSGALQSEYHLDAIKHSRKGWFSAWVSVKEGEYAVTAKEVISLEEQFVHRTKLQLTVFDNGAGGCVLTIREAEGSPATTSTITSTTVPYASGQMQAFVLVSWEFVPDPADIANSEWKASITAIQNGATGGVYFAYGSVSDTGGWISEVNDFYVLLDVEGSNLKMSHFTLQYGDYLQDRSHAMQMIRFMPLFPTGAIGIDYDTTVAIAGANYYTNQSITFNNISTTTDLLPGRIFWTNYGAMLGINEQNLHDEIQRIVPMKSFMPTDEHNTILIWTRKDMWRMPLMNNLTDSKPVLERPGDGLTNRYALSLVPDGVAWHNDDGVIYMTSNSIQNVSRDRIKYTSAPYIFPDYANRRFWLKDTYLWLFDVVAKTISKAVLVPAAATVTLGGWFVDGNGTNHILHTGDMFLYSFTGETNHTTALHTKGYSIGRKNKLRRWKLIGNLFTGTYTYLQRLLGTKIGQGAYIGLTPIATTWTQDTTGLAYTHVAGNTTALVATHTPVVGKSYTVNYTLSNALNTVTFAGNTLTATGTYPLTVSTTVTATTTAALTFTPISASTPRVSNVSIYSGHVDGSSYTGYYNRWTGTPNAKSDYVQVLLTNPNKVNGIEIEVK